MAFAFKAYYCGVVGLVLASVCPQPHYGSNLAAFAGPCDGDPLGDPPALSGEFALVACAALALNGQEWFQDRFGVGGHLGRGWAIWSTGGRAATIVAIFAVIVLKSLTAYASTPESCRSAGAQARVLVRGGRLPQGGPAEGPRVQPLAALGDSLIWHTWPDARPRWRTTPGKLTFIDSRRHLFPASLKAQQRTLRKALQRRSDGVGADPRRRQRDGRDAHERDPERPRSSTTR